MEEPPKEPGVLAVPNGEDDCEPRVETTDDPLYDRIHLLVHLHSDRLEMERSDIDKWLESYDTGELLRRIEDELGIEPGPPT